MSVIVALSVIAATAPQLAWAEDPPPTREQLDAAKKAFVAGKAFYDQGKFAEAIEKLQESYRLSRNPLLLYSIARSFDQLGKKDDALTYYRKFLADAPPNAAQRAEVTGRVESIEKEKAVAKPPEPVVSPVKPAFELQHQSVEAVPPGKPHDVSVSVPEDPGLVVTLFYRGSDESTFTASPMTRRDKEVVAAIPAAKIAGSSIQYYIEVRDPAGTLVTRSGKSTSPHVVRVLDKPVEVITPDVPKREVEDPLAAKQRIEVPPEPPGITAETAARIKNAKWISTATAGALLGGAMISYLVAWRQADNLEDDSTSCGSPPCRPFDATYDQAYESTGKRYNTVHQVMLGASVVAAGVAGYFWYRDLTAKRRDEGVVVTPAVGDNFAGAALGGRF